MGTMVKVRWGDGPNQNRRWTSPEKLLMSLLGMSALLQNMDPENTPVKLIVIPLQASCFESAC